MTAPGDSVLVFILLAVFVASLAYAAGRLHQRYQLRQDREDAYRDGYETASSRVFSLAARAVSARRTARATASVRSGRPRRSAAHAIAAGETPTGPTPATPHAAPSRPAHGSPAAPSGPTAEPPGPPRADASAVRGSAHASRRADPGRAVRHQGVAAKQNSAPPRSAVPPAPAADSSSLLAESARLGESARLAGPDEVLGRRPSRRRAPESPAGSLLGFPVPPPPPLHTRCEPTAVGGVSYQPFPDPRPADGSAPVLGRRSPEPASPIDSPADPSEDQDENTSDEAGPDKPRERPSGGKHTVPDELVRAVTYRLPPDRIFRAKVPNSTPLPEQTTTPLAVPKPRRRANENVAPPP
ncbi:MAG TPA: hypothetical protein VFG35_10165 [Actinoplanes sp.]|nr:hypothetical protein [Actinoplanes sp.]